MSGRESRESSAPGAEAAEVLPRPFGSYILLENFARGGMGEVYLAKSGGIVGLERYCVLKKLRADLTRDQEYRTRFIDEARVVVHLNHANICHVFEVGLVESEYFLAMEYISGRDLRTVQDRGRLRGITLAPELALLIVCETLEALDYAHRASHPGTGEPLHLVHRDVSPQNVLVSYEGEVKLIDFGLAASRLKVERTQPNVVMGKMAYMAPEQARGDAIDHRADLFACGVLAYELLVGERFYEGMGANDIWQVAGRGGFTPRLWNTLDGPVAKLLARALHPEPKKRFSSCGDFREALAGYLFSRHPGVGVRVVRDAMASLFDDELRAEREMLARFGTVTVAGFRASLENTASQSISLARSDVSLAASPRTMQGERSASTPSGPMPPPDEPGARGRDLHQEPTRLASGGFLMTGTRAPPPGSANASLAIPSDTDPAVNELPSEDSAPTLRQRVEQTPEGTERVERRRDRQAAITGRFSQAPILQVPRKRRIAWPPLVAGTLAAGLIFSWAGSRMREDSRQLPSVEPRIVPPVAAAAITNAASLVPGAAPPGAAPPVADPSLIPPAAPDPGAASLTAPTSDPPNQAIAAGVADETSVPEGAPVAAAENNRLRGAHVDRSNGGEHRNRRRERESPEHPEPVRSAAATAEPPPDSEPAPQPRIWREETLRQLSNQVECHPTCVMLVARSGVTQGNADSVERCIKKNCR